MRRLLALWLARFVRTSSEIKLVYMSYTLSTSHDVCDDTVVMASCSRRSVGTAERKFSWHLSYLVASRAHNEREASCERENIREGISMGRHVCTTSPSMKECVSGFAGQRKEILVRQ